MDIQLYLFIDNEATQKIKVFNNGMSKARLIIITVNLLKKEVLPLTSRYGDAKAYRFQTVECIWKM